MRDGRLPGGASCPSCRTCRLNRPADGEREKAEFDRLNVLPGGKLQN